MEDSSFANKDIRYFRQFHRSQIQVTNSVRQSKQLCIVYPQRQDKLLVSPLRFELCDTPFILWPRSLSIPRRNKWDKKSCFFSKFSPKTHHQDVYQTNALEKSHQKMHSPPSPQEVHSAPSRVRGTRWKTTVQNRTHSAFQRIPVSRCLAPRSTSSKSVSRCLSPGPSLYSSI